MDRKGRRARKGLKFSPRNRGDETSIGGQAVIEGVMFRGRKRWSLAVRRPDGSIHVEVHPLDSLLDKRPWRMPLLRGLAALWENLKLGWKALTLSADLALEGEGEMGGIGRAITVVLAVALVVGLFVFLPTWIASHLVSRETSTFLFNLVEGAVRLAVFVAYLVAISLSGEMRRILRYHGAEHQSIHLLEKGLPLEAEHALKQGTDHLRCGTSFLLLLVFLTVVVYSLLGRPALWLRVLERVALIPLLAGMSYEIIKAADRRRESPFWRALAAPGLALQRLTTRRPGREEVEVALAALKSLLGSEGEGREGSEDGGRMTGELLTGGTEDGLRG